MQLREVNIIREGDKPKKFVFGLQRRGFTIGEENREEKRKKRKKRRKKKDKIKIRYGILYVWVFDMNPKVLDGDLFLLWSRFYVKITQTFELLGL